MRDVLTTACAPMLWGSTYVVALYVLPQGVPFQNAALRILPIGLVVLFFHPRSNTMPWSFRLVVLATLNITLFQASLFFAAMHLPGGIVATLLATAALIGSILNPLISKRRPSLIVLSAATAGAFGVGIITVDLGAIELLLNDWDNVVVAISVALLGATSVAVGTILTARWTSAGSIALSNSKEAVHNSLAFTSKQLVAGGALLALLALFFEEPFANYRDIGPGAFAGLAYLALPGTLLAHSLWFRGVSRLDPRMTLALRLLSPVIASLIDAMIPLFIVHPKFNQPFTPWRWVGTVIVLLAIVVVGTVARRPERDQQRTEFAK